LLSTDAVLSYLFDVMVPISFEFCGDQLLRVVMVLGLNRCNRGIAR